MKVVGVDRARAKKRLIQGPSVLTAIGKRPCGGATAVNKLGLGRDEQAALTAHGRPFKAVYAYPAAHYVFCKRGCRTASVTS